eukprot:562272-Heterocapsa_arctica.AAC.1
MSPPDTRKCNASTGGASSYGSTCLGCPPAASVRNAGAVDAAGSHRAPIDGAHAGADRAHHSRKA